MPTVSTAASIGADITFQRRHELRTLGMVFHGRGISLGVRQDLALRVDHRGASPGGAAFVPDDTFANRRAARNRMSRTLIQRGQRTNAIHVNGEHLRLLPEIELDLLKERFFPGMVDREIEGHGGRGNHQDKGSQQLEKYPLPHFGASKR